MKSYPLLSFSSLFSSAFYLLKCWNWGAGTTQSLRLRNSVYIANFTGLSLLTVMISVANLSFPSSATHPFQEMEPIRKTHSKIRRPGGFFFNPTTAVWFKYKVVRVVTIAQGGHCGPSKRQLSSDQKVFPKVKSFPQRARKCHWQNIWKKGAKIQKKSVLSLQRTGNSDTF